MANEKIILTTPITAPAIADYTPGSLLLALVPEPRIVVTIIRNSDGRGEVFEYPASGVTSADTPAGVAALVETLNTLNLSTRSLWRRIFDRLVADFPARFPGGASIS